MEFIRQIIRGHPLRSASAGPIAYRVAGLNHESVNDAMEDDSVVEIVLDKVEEVASGDRRFVGKEFHLDRAETRFELDDWQSAGVRRGRFCSARFAELVEPVEKDAVPK